MMVVFMGPDGSGKTTVIEGVRKKLEASFQGIEYFHLRFPLRSKQQQQCLPVTDPHGQKKYNLFISICKLLYFIVLYQAGYWLNRRKIKSNECLLMFDRYYPDLLVDPKRFRYGAPLWMAERVTSLIPQPQMYILLEAPTEVLQARKQEVPFEETERQRKMYLSLFSRLPQGHVINSNRSIEEIIIEVAGIILQRTCRE